MALSTIIRAQSSVAAATLRAELNDIPFSPLFTADEESAMDAEVYGFAMGAE